MLEASDFDAIDNVPPFLGVVVDNKRGHYLIIEVAKAFTKYLDLAIFIFLCHLNVKEMEKALQNLNSRNESFQKKDKFAFGRYQVSVKLAQKWYAVGHISGVLSHVV